MARRKSEPVGVQQAVDASMEEAQVAAAAEAEREAREQEDKAHAGVPDEDDRGVPPPTAADAQREVALSVAARPDELPAGVGDKSASERYLDEHPDASPNGETDGKRRAIIALVGTDRNTGERKEIHVGRSKRAVRKWAASAMFLLERCFADLKLAIIKEEDL